MWESVSGTSYARIRIRYYKLCENPYQVLQVTRAASERAMKSKVRLIKNHHSTKLYRKNITWTKGTNVTEHVYILHGTHVPTLPIHQVYISCRYTCLDIAILPGTYVTATWFYKPCLWNVHPGSKPFNLSHFPGPSLLSSFWSLTTCTNGGGRLRRICLSHEWCQWLTEGGQRGRGVPTKRACFTNVFFVQN